MKRPIFPHTDRPDRLRFGAVGAVRNVLPRIGLAPLRVHLGTHTLDGRTAKNDLKRRGIGL